MVLKNGPHRGTVTAPRSKSHEHRLLIADFLAGDDTRLVDVPDDSADILATKRCLRALRTDETAPMLDCGESGSTRRFLGPVAAVLGKRPVFVTAGRLGQRPQFDYPDLAPGEFRLPGDVSSQFVTGLLFALPLLPGESFIRFDSPLQSRGYVDLTLRVLAGAGIYISLQDDGFGIPGGQSYHSQASCPIEGDWSAAAFWYAMNALGSEVMVDGVDVKSVQPDRVVTELVRRISSAWTNEAVTVDVSGCPDLFPTLSVVAAGSPGVTTFVGTHRLKLKESDRTAAMAEVLERFGVKPDCQEDRFVVKGSVRPFKGGRFASFGDHRIAMSVAVGATCAEGTVELDDAECARKSYPAFFAEFERTYTQLSRLTNRRQK